MQVLSFDMEYDKRREREYPKIGDQVDAIMKLANHLRQQGADLPTEVCEWVDKCLEVKRRHPKQPDSNPPA